MNDYKQPEFYRFNEDSLRLVKFVTARTPSAWNVLDAGAGCGVIGLEFCQAVRCQNLTLLELQEEFRDYLDENVMGFSPRGLQTEIVISSFAKWKPSRKYDLIISNPPYFLPGHGEASGDPSRDLARSFKQDGWRALLELINEALAPNGHAYIVVKNNKVLTREIHHYMPTTLELREHEDTDLVFLELVRLDVK